MIDWEISNYVAFSLRLVFWYIQLCYCDILKMSGEQYLSFQNVVVTCLVMFAHDSRTSRTSLLPCLSQVAVTARQCGRLSAQPDLIYNFSPWLEFDVLVACPAYNARHYICSSVIWQTNMKTHQGRSGGKVLGRGRWRRGWASSYK